MIILNTMRLLGVMILSSYLLIGCWDDHAFPAQQVDNNTIEAILGEAEDQGYIGKLAVACAIQNRPEKLNGVQGFPAKRWEIASKDMVIDCALAYFESLEPYNCAFLEDADMWHSGDMPISWANVPMVFVKTIRDHHFYRRLK